MYIVFRRYAVYDVLRAAFISGLFLLVSLHGNDTLSDARSRAGTRPVAYCHAIAYAVAFRRFRTVAYRDTAAHGYALPDAGGVTAARAVSFGCGMRSALREQCSVA